MNFNAPKVKYSLLHCANICLFVGKGRSLSQIHCLIDVYRSCPLLIFFLQCSGNWITFMVDCPNYAIDTHIYQAWSWEGNDRTVQLHKAHSFILFLRASLFTYSSVSDFFCLDFRYYTEHSAFIHFFINCRT